MELQKTNQYEVKPVIWTLLFGGLFTAFGPLVLMKEVDLWSLVWWGLYFLASHMALGLWLGIIILFKKGFSLFKTLFKKGSLNTFLKIEDDNFSHKGVAFTWMFIPHAFMTWWSYSWWISDNLAYSSWMMVLFGLIQGISFYIAYNNGYLPEYSPYWGLICLTFIIAFILNPGAFIAINEEDYSDVEEDNEEEEKPDLPTFYKRFKNFEDFR